MTSLFDYAGEPAAVPKGWEPFHEEIGKIGSAVVRLPEPGATHHDLLLGAGFDPDDWQIDGPVQYRKWQRADGEWLNYYKFSVVAGQESGEQREADIDALTKMIRGPRRTHKPAPTGEDAWLFSVSDWQIGKGEGDGTAGTVARVQDAIAQAVNQVKMLRRLGRAMPTGVLAGTGDLGEGCGGFFSNQPFVTDLNRRDQNRVTRALLTLAIDELAPMFDDFIVLTVPGNHGENRNDFKKATDDADNDDVAQFECVKEAFDRHPGDSNLTWLIPDHELSLAIEVGGTSIGFAHGHQFTRGGTMSQAKALEWWKGQVFGDQPVSKAQLLISSHFHHFSIINHGFRTHFQTPAMDPGSKWVTDAWGSDSPAGVLTMRIDGTELMGFDDVRILGGGRERS